MATFPRITLLAVAAAVVVALSGCLAPLPDPKPAPAPTADPVFASEEEALAAATKAYAAYLAVSDEITSGIADAEQIAPLVTDEYKILETNGFEKLRTDGIVTSGQSTFDSVRLQQYSDSISETDSFTAYLCSDISSVRLVDSNGQDVTPPERMNRLPLEIDFYFDTDDPSQLLIGRSDVWSGTNFC